MSTAVFALLGAALSSSALRRCDPSMKSAVPLHADSGLSLCIWNVEANCGFSEPGHYITMSLQKQIDGEENQYGGIAFKEANLVDAPNEIWYMGGINCIAPTVCHECRSPSDACRLGVLYMHPQEMIGYKTPNFDAVSDDTMYSPMTGDQGYLTGGPIVNFLLSTPAHSECISTTSEHICTFFRPHSVLTSPGMKDLSSTNLDAFVWKQVWNYGPFGIMQHHGDNIHEFSVENDLENVCLTFEYSRKEP